LRQIHSRRRDRDVGGAGRSGGHRDPAGGRRNPTTATPDPGTAGCRRPRRPEPQPSRAAGGLLRPSGLLRSELSIGTPRARHLPSNNDGVEERGVGCPRAIGEGGAGRERRSRCGLARHAHAHTGRETRWRTETRRGERSREKERAVAWHTKGRSCWLDALLCRQKRTR
jgi:hypothetical protein